MIVIAGGDVLTKDGWTQTDVVVEGERIVAIGDDLPGESRIDAGGCLVGPGLVDVHTHCREPGQTWKEDIESTSRAAGAGGFTSVVAMPNTEPAMDDVKTIEAVRERGREVGMIDLIPAAAMTRNRAGTEITDLEELYDAGVRLFSDDGDPVEDDKLILEIMRRLADLPGAVLAQHAEVKSMTHEGHMHQGQVSRSLGIGGMPAEAESAQVARDLDLVARTGVRYHCQHVSAAQTVDLLAQATGSGLNVTSEVTPHHLSFTDEDVVGLNPNFKMYPPLRSSDDRDALVEALQDGTITMVATDHAPHSVEEKSVAFNEAPRGVIGLETSAAVTWDMLGDRDRFFEVMSTNPGRLIGVGPSELEVGQAADIVVFDPGTRWTPERFESKSTNSPFLGRHLKGRVMTTVYRGGITHG